MNLFDLLQQQIFMSKRPKLKQSIVPTNIYKYLSFPYLSRAKTEHTNK